MVLRAWSEADPSAAGARLELVEIGGGAGTSLASHAEGVSSGDSFVHEGAPRSFSALWTPRSSTDPHVLASAGEALYARLAQGAVGEALESLGNGVRVRIELRSKELERLPWELLRRGSQRLFMRPHQPWSLGAEAPPRLDPAVPGPTPSELPIRVLVVVGHEEDDVQVLGDEELRRLEDRLHERRTHILLASLVRPRSDEIRLALKAFRPHVFHFIGHGDEADGVPVFRVWSEVDASSTCWNADDVQAALADTPSVPRLVILNACQLGRPRGSWAVTESFLDAGVLAVLSVQADIGGDAAVELGDALYASLAKNDPIDVATASARLAIANAGDKTSWPMPRLVARGPMEDVLPQPALERPRARAVDDFVHRWDHRRIVWETLCPQHAARSRLVVVEGAKGSGKTELLKFLADMWTSIGSYPALYVHGGPRTSDLSILVDDVRNHAAAQGFDLGPLPALPGGTSNKDVAEALRAALETYGKAGPLLFLLDGLDGWDPNALSQLIVDELCEPYATPDSSSNVRVVLALQKHGFLERRWSELGVAPLRLDAFRPDEWKRGASQFLRIQRAKLEGGHRDPSPFEAAAWPVAFLAKPDKIVNPAMPAYDAGLLGIIRQLRRILEHR